MRGKLLIFDNFDESEAFNVQFGIEHLIFSLNSALINEDLVKFRPELLPF